MSDTEEAGSESGLYRLVTGKMFSVIVFILWSMLAVISGIIWTDVQAGKTAITTLQAQRISDVEERESFKKQIVADMVELKADIKELLREARR